MRKLIRRLFGKTDPELVPYYDFETKHTVRIPKCELSPGAVLIQIQGESEPVYADAPQLKEGEHQHESLPAELLTAIQEIQEELADVRPMDNDEWVDGFRRDANPDREIAGWLHLSHILRVMTNRHGYTLAQREECFRVLVACFTGARETVRNRSDPTLLPSDQIDQAIQYFFEGGY